MLNIKKLGGNASFTHRYAENESTRRIFNYVTDRLIQDYKNSQDPKIADWLKTAFYPNEGTTFYNQLLKRWSSKGKEEVQDAALGSYEQTMLKPGTLEKLVDLYEPGSGRFGGLVLNTLNQYMKNYFMRGFKGGSGKDMFAGGSTDSIDAPQGDSDRTLGDTLGSGMQGDFADTAEMDKFKESYAAALGWLKNNVSEKQYVAWRELTQGDSPVQIAEEYPELFENPKAVSRHFSQLKSSDKAKELSDLISHAFKMDWSMEDMEPKSLRQTYSMDPSFDDSGEFTKRTKISTPDMKSAQDKLKNVMGSLGLKPAQFNSEVKINKILEKLREEGNDEKANEIEDVLNDLENATEKAKSRGQYDVNMPFVPSSEEEEAGVSKYFENVNIKGVDLDALMERVMRRIG